MEKKLTTKLLFAQTAKKTLNPKGINIGGVFAIGCLTPIILFILMIIILTIIGSNVSDDKNTTATKKEPQKTQQKDKPKLEILKTYNCNATAYGGRAICGTVINNTDKTYGYAQVEINLYDQNGTQIGNTIDNVNNLAAHSKWEFKAMIVDERADNYKVVGVSGY